MSSQDFIRLGLQFALMLGFALFRAQFLCPDLFCFDGTLVVLILVAACVTKIGSVLIGARLAGMPINRESLAIGFGLNVRGATGIILAGVGLTNNLIDERIFVALL